MGEHLSTVTGTAASQTVSQATTNGGNWQAALSAWLDEWHSHAVTKAEHVLNAASRVDLTATNPKHLSWGEEWSQLNSFAMWPSWDSYQECTMNAYRGLQDIGFWVWLTVRPWLYSALYLLWRFAQNILGRLLPTVQYATIEICRFQLHLTWRQALGELACVSVCFSFYKLVKYLQKKKYIQRTRKYITRKSQQVTKAIQSAYQELFQVSILLAMAIPHMAYLGICLGIKALLPSWVLWLSTETQASSILKFWYPLAATIMVLHHARGFAASDVLKNGDGSGSKKHKSATEVVKPASAEKSKDKKDNRRRRSSFGIPGIFSCTAPRANEKKDDNLASASSLLVPPPSDGDYSVYTEAEMHADVNYWLHFWVLGSIFKAMHILVTQIIFVRSVFLHPALHSSLCQLEMLFYIWIYCLPPCVAVLYPTAGDKTSKDWSAAKKWCYQVALDPVLQLPNIFLPVVVPFFEQISQAISARLWKRMVVDKVDPIISALVFIRVLTPTQKDIALDCLTNFHSLVLPSLTFFSPGFIHQYGVWYVEFIVPQAHSFRALHKQYIHHHSQRILYLKFWVLHAIIAPLLSYITRTFWWILFGTHATFIVWCVMTMPRIINSIYHEFDRELQAFGLLPQVADDLSVENTHTVRALSYLATKLPSAVEKEMEADDAKLANDENEDGHDDDSSSDKNGKLQGIKNGSQGKEKEGKENQIMILKSKNSKGKEGDTITNDGSSKNDCPSPEAVGESDLSPGQQLLRRSTRQRRKVSSPVSS